MDIIDFGIFEDIEPEPFPVSIPEDLDRESEENGVDWTDYATPLTIELHLAQLSGRELTLLSEQLDYYIPVMSV